MKCRIVVRSNRTIVSAIDLQFHHAFGGKGRPFEYKVFIRTHLGQIAQIHAVFGLRIMLSDNNSAYSDRDLTSVQR